MGGVGVWGVFKDILICQFVSGWLRRGAAPNQGRRNERRGRWQSDDLRRVVGRSVETKVKVVVVGGGGGVGGVEVVVGGV